MTDIVNYLDSLSRRLSEEGITLLEAALLNVEGASNGEIQAAQELLGGYREVEAQIRVINDIKAYLTRTLI